MNRCRSSSLRPSPSLVTSPETTEMRCSQIVSNSSPHCDLRMSKASLRSISRSTRRWALLLRFGRTRSTSSQSGTPRRSRSTRAVPKNPVLPVMAIRLPERDSLITTLVLSENLPNGKYLWGFDLKCWSAHWYPRSYFGLGVSCIWHARVRRNFVG